MTDATEFVEKELNRYRKAFVELDLPDYMWASTRRYVAQGIPPGHFLSAVISNNLSEAVAHGDDINSRCLPQWVKFFYNNPPGQCWGSPERFDNWIKAGGMCGLHEAKT